MATNGSSSGRFNPADLFTMGQEALRQFGNPRVPLAVKVLPLVLGLAYLVSPIDLAPDFLPILGQLDDIAILLLGMRLFTQFASRYDGTAASPAPAGVGAPAESVSTSYRVR